MDFSPMFSMLFSSIHGLPGDNEQKLLSFAGALIFLFFHLHQNPPRWGGVTADAHFAARIIIALFICVIVGYTATEHAYPNADVLIFWATIIGAAGALTYLLMLFGEVV